MKRKIWIPLVITMFLSAITGLVTCDLEDADCKECKTITIDSTGTKISETEPNIYCGGELEIKENEEPVVIGTDTTKWVCE